MTTTTKPANKIRTYSFDRCKMYEHLTLEELTALRQQVEADPKSQNPRYLSGQDINLYTVAARKKLDNIAWVITWKLADLRAQRGEPVLADGYSGRNCNRV